MDLILWRHAEAEPGEPDVGRRLTAKGIKQASRVGAWLDQQLPTTCRILVSPADRAQQTAVALKRRFRTVDALGPGGSVAALLTAANWPESREPVLVVGHQPTLGRVAAALIADVEDDWSVKKGAAWWFTCRNRVGIASVALRAVIGPDLVPRVVPIDAGTARADAVTPQALS
jgi:phosphohistidine phosphatase